MDRQRVRGLPRLHRGAIGDGAWVMVGQGAGGILTLAGTREKWSNEWMRKYPLSCRME